MTARRRSYPDTPAGHARELRDAENNYLARLGHSMTWARGHGVSFLRDDPGYKGRCGRCGGIARLAWLSDHAAYNGYEGAMAKKFLTGPRRCTRGRS